MGKSDDTPKGTVPAKWVGPYGHRLADGTVLETNVTIVEMPADEAEASDYWKVQPPAAPSAKGGDA